MNSGTLALLDQAELFQLGINASSAGDSGSAIAYLKEAVSRADGTALAHYILGAEYAQIKMYPRAIDEMEAAIALDPALASARLQLGLLWLGANEAARAADVLAGLNDLADMDPLRHFGAGLQQLIRNELDAAEASLNEGMALNTSNAALNADMQRIVQEIAAIRAGGAAADSAPAEASAEASHHVLLSAYAGNTGN